MYRCFLARRETVPLDLERVEDITKAPEENDNISLTPVQTSCRAHFTSCNLN